MKHRPTRIGLFFGSFNPIHIGHLIIANYLAEAGEMDQVWFVVSPHNPLKSRNTLAKDQERLHMVRLAVDDNPRLQASNIEFGLPKPSYTIDTLAYLKDKYPEHQFYLIMGSDNLATIDKWKNYDILLRDYPILVYQRPGSIITRLPENAAITIVEAPLLDISATFIREGLKKGLSMRYLLPEPVYEYLTGSNLYKS